MLQILHKGIQANLDLDTSTFTGVLEDDLQLAYVTDMIAGRLVGLDDTGLMQLADGLTANKPHAIGFLINDVGGYFFENKPAMASLKASVTFGNCVVITDQIDVDIVAGDLLYAATGVGNVGLVTNAPGAGSDVIGIAANSALVATSPELTIYVK